MWYEMKRQFIDAAARVMWAYAWGNQREELIDDFRNGELPVDWPDQTAQEYVGKRGWPESMQGVELTDAAPPTPDYARLEAAILLGKLEQANGCGLAVIVEAAEQADNSAAIMAIVEDSVYSPGSLYEVDVAEFASAVALMALGTGVSWTDGHEVFRVPTRSGDVNKCAKCDYDMADYVHGPKAVCQNTHMGHSSSFHHDYVARQSEFVVPSIEFAYEEGEE